MKYEDMTSERKESMRKYNTSPAGREARKRYNVSKKGRKARSDRYYAKKQEAALERLASQILDKTGKWIIGRILPGGIRQAIEPWEPWEEVK